ncbi:MAG: ABC transporter substrate-binding protein [Bacteroidetes bacterium]|nr:ABC transporter substrate-binding protein [Fibrella sp.]
MTAIRLALDWTPNTLHTGFYVALATGSYQRAGLDVQITTPEADHYQTTPARQLAGGAVDLAVMPSESVISYHANDPDSQFVAIATLLSRDASAIVTLKQNGLDRPQQLDGRVYASYNARFEDDIVKQMIRNDGGRGQFVSHKPERLGIWHTLLTNEADATWIFLPWEGVEAELRGVELNKFLLEEYEIPYGYSPLLVANRDWLATNADALQRFMQASAAGYQFAVAQPDEAARMLAETANHPTLANREFLEMSQQSASGYYLSGTNWGIMRREVWNGFVNWLIRHDLIIDREGEKIQHIDVDRLFTNQFVK